MPYNTGHRVTKIVYLSRYLFHSYRDLKPLNAIILILKIKYKKKKSRTPLNVPRIIELFKDINPSLD